MRMGSITLVAGAAVCAAAAALLTKTWLAANVAQPAVQVVERSTPEKIDMRTVVVATRPLPFGTKLTAAALAERKWPAASVPRGVFHSKADLLKGDRTVLAAIIKDEPILNSKVTAPGQRASLSFVIEKGKKAVTIRVDDVLGVGGFVQPDDRVDVLLTRKSRGSKAYTDVLLQDVRVLAIDQLADRNTAQAKPARTVTVEVLTLDAQKLVLAASVGQLSLVLRHAGWSHMANPRRIGVNDLIKSKSAPAASGESPVVTVTRATNRKHYEVEFGEADAYEEQPDGQVAGSSEPSAASEPDGTQTSAVAPEQNRFFGSGEPGSAQGSDEDSELIVSPVPIGPE